MKTEHNEVGIMIADVTLVQLRDVLSNLYNTPTKARGVALAIGLNPATIDFGGSSQDYWLSLLTETSKHHKIDTLITHVESEYGENLGFQKVATGFRSTFKQRLGAHATGQKTNSLDEISARQRMTLAQLLLSCQSVMDDTTRSQMVSTLRSSIRNNVHFASTPLGHVISILTACQNFEGGVQEFIEIVRLYENGTTPIRKVDELIFTITATDG